ncbi:MAG: XRE family transcriptional regulator [Ignavibacteriae bacterium]|nr:MAG: XRE family transcriptional regulator [Ignavibacteriota bacterium]
MKTKGKTIGSLIKHYRVLKGLTQEQVAEALDITYQQVQKYEYDQSTPPLDKLIMLSKILEVPTEAFLNENLRHNLLTKIEAVIEKNYAIVKLADEYTEFRRLANIYTSHKEVLSQMDLSKLLEGIASIPSDKRTAAITSLEYFVSLLS